ncbi:hypothetical protein, partial [Lacticaseibacillus paracasei]
VSGYADKFVQKFGLNLQSTNLSIQLSKSINEPIVVIFPVSASFLAFDAPGESRKLTNTSLLAVLTGAIVLSFLILGTHLIRLQMFTVFVRLQLT